MGWPMPDQVPCPHAFSKTPWRRESNRLPDALCTNRGHEVRRTTRFFPRRIRRTLGLLRRAFYGCQTPVKTVETKKVAVTQSGTGMRLTSLDSPKFAALRASSGDRFLLDGRTDSFDERFAGARAPAKAMDDPKEGAGHVSRARTLMGRSTHRGQFGGNRLIPLS